VADHSCTLLALAALTVVGASATFSACKSNGDQKPAATSASSQASVNRADTEPAYGITSKLEGTCVAGTPCTVKVHLVAARDYHVNEEYPYRFVPQPTKTLTFASPSPAFTKESEREGTLPISFIPKSTGPEKVEGTFKLSVCNKDVCLIEESRVGVDVVVTSP